MKIYLSKIKESDEKLNAHRKRHTLAQIKYRKKQTSNQENAMEMRTKNAEYMKSYRDKKKAANQTQSSSSSSSFSTKNGLNKAVRRVMKAMPKDEEKSEEVLLHVVEKSKIISRKQKKVLRKYRRSTTREKITEFYSYNDVSYQFPGKNDFIKIKNENGVKVAVQKRQMLMPIEQAFQKFKNLFPHVKVSLSTFFKARPRNIISYDKIKQNFCTCTYCENMKLWHEAISPFLCTETKSLREMLVKLLCHRFNYECCARNCEECADIEEKLSSILPDDHENEPINMKTWGKAKNGYVQKINSPVKFVRDAKQWFRDNFDHYVMHKYLIKVQFDCLRDLRENLQENHAYVTMDFSNNFQTMSQDEVQAAFFGRHYIEVFTCIVHVGSQKPISFIITNDKASHSKEHVFFYIRLIIAELKQKFPQLVNIHFVSDGAASQFKNRYTLSNLLFMMKEFDLIATHQFTPSNHGKNAVDGLGGIVKRGVFKRIMTRKAEVYNSKEFIDCAKDIFGSIIFFHTDDKIINQMKSKLMTPRWNKIVKNAAAPRNCHFFESSVDGKKLIAYISSMKEQQIIIKMFP